MTPTRSVPPLVGVPPPPPLLVALEVSDELLPQAASAPAPLRTTAPAPA